MEPHAASPAPHAQTSRSRSTGAAGKEPIPPREDAVAQLRARLLRLIVANETSRSVSAVDSSKPR